MAVASRLTFRSAGAMVARETSNLEVAGSSPAWSSRACRCAMLRRAFFVRTGFGGDDIPGLTAHTTPASSFLRK